jgi:MarR family transcriptional regulator, organic hydroperoxide resistance regulator
LAGKLSDRVFISFIRTSRAVGKYYDARLYSKMRFSAVKMAVLTALNFNREGMTPSEIASQTCTEPNNITTLVRRMAKEGLLRTESRKDDRRSVKVVITDLGLEVFAEASAIPGDVRDEVLSLIPRDDMKALERALEIMRHNALVGIQNLNRRRLRAAPQRKATT